MAKRFPSQNSLVVDRAAIELDEDTGAFRLILTDEELPAGLVLNVPKGGKIEKTLRSLFEAPQDLGGASSVATPQPETTPSNPTIVTTQTEPVKLEPTYQESEEPQPEEKKGPTPKTERTNTSNSVQSFGKIPKLDLTKKGNLVSIVSPREKTSKSTASLMLGAALARTPEVANLDNPHKVVVVDLDTTQGTLFSLVPPTAKGSMGVYESGVINIDTLLANMTYNNGLGVYTLPINDQKWNALNWLGLDFFSRVVDVLKEHFAVVIVDTPSKDFSYVTQEVINASDIIFITNTIERRQEFTTRQWLQDHLRFKRVAEKATVLLTNTPKAQAQGAWEDVKRTHTPISVIGNISMDSAGFLNAVKNNQLPALFNTDNQVVEDYGVIADRIV